MPYDAEQSSTPTVNTYRATLHNGSCTLFATSLPKVSDNNSPVNGSPSAFVQEILDVIDVSTLGANQ